MRPTAIIVGYKSIALVAAVGIILVGCAAPPQPVVRQGLSSVYHGYHTQAYDGCLAQIERLMLTHQSLEMRAHLLMIKANCLQEQGLQKQADDVYREVESKFPGSRFAAGAKRRLSREGADQKEHLEFDFSPELWRRDLKTWNRTEVRVEFHRAIERRDHGGAFMVLTSADRTGDLKTPAEVVARLQADAALTDGKMEIQLLTQTENDATFERRLNAPDGTLKFIALTRIVLTPQRAHSASYCRRENIFSPEEKEEWAARLKSAKIVGGK